MTDVEDLSRCDLSDRVGGCDDHLRHSISIASMRLYTGIPHISNDIEYGHRDERFSSSDPVFFLAMFGAYGRWD